MKVYILTYYYQVVIDISATVQYQTGTVWRVLRDRARRLIVHAGWQVGTRDRIKAGPHWDGLSGKEDDGWMRICLCSEVEPVGLSQQEARD